VPGGCGWGSCARERARPCQNSSTSSDFVPLCSRQWEGLRTVMPLLSLSRDLQWLILQHVAPWKVHESPAVLTVVIKCRDVRGAMVSSRTLVAAALRFFAPSMKVPHEPCDGIRFGARRGLSESVHVHKVS